MGQTLRWLCTKGLGEKELFRSTGLKKRGEHVDCLEELSFLDLVNGWLLIAENNCSESFGQYEALLKKLSKTAEVVVYYLHENLNISTVEYWKGGTQIWFIERNAQIAADHLVATGTVPFIFEQLKNEAQRKSAADIRPNCDYLLDVPEAIAESFCGVSQLILDNTQFEILDTNKSSPLGTSSRLEGKIFENLDKLLAKHDFQRRKGAKNIYTRDMGNGFTGILRFDIDRKYSFNFTPVVGVRHDATELLCDKLLESAPHKYIVPTTCEELLRLTPQKRSMPFYFQTEADLEKIDDIYNKFLKYGIPFIEKTANFAELEIAIERIKFGSPLRVVTTLAVLKCLGGHTQAGMTFLQQVVDRANGPYRETLDRFAENFYKHFSETK